MIQVISTVICVTIILASSLLYAEAHSEAISIEDVPLDVVDVLREEHQNADDHQLVLLYLEEKDLYDAFHRSNEERNRLTLN